MIGRATRRCDEIGKTVFKIYGPVDIYAALQDVSTMKPLVRDPNVTIEQLIDELTDPNLLKANMETKDAQHADDVLAELSQKVMRVMRKAFKVSENNPELKAINFIQQIGGLIQHVNEIKLILGSERMPLIYEGDDEFLERKQTYGVKEKPADYLISFNGFIKHNINRSAALAVVINRPKDLTREQLKEIKLLQRSSIDDSASCPTLGDELLAQVAFVGGCTTGLHITDELTKEKVRYTEDVDLIIHVIGYTGWHKFSEQVTARGFKISMEDEVNCRFRLGSLCVDFMPDDESVLGYSNQWYSEALTTHNLIG